MIINNVSALRKKFGLTQNALSKIVGVERSVISRWEDGSINMTAKNIIKLSEAFNCTTDEVLGIVVMKGGPE